MIKLQRRKEIERGRNRHTNSEKRMKEQESNTLVIGWCWQLSILFAFSDIGDINGFLILH